MEDKRYTFGAVHFDFRVVVGVEDSRDYDSAMQFARRQILRALREIDAHFHRASATFEGQPLMQEPHGILERSSVE